MAKPNPKITELQADIETITATINDPDTPEELRADLKSSLTEMESALKKLKIPKESKPKKEKPAKPEVRLGSKSFKETTSKELEEAFGKRLERVNELGGKSKTKSIFYSENGNAPSSEATVVETTE
jgi:hypothetical protein